MANFVVGNTLSRFYPGLFRVCQRNKTLWGQMGVCPKNDINSFLLGICQSGNIGLLELLRAKEHSPVSFVQVGNNRTVGPSLHFFGEQRILIPHKAPGLAVEHKLLELDGGNLPSLVANILGNIKNVGHWLTTENHQCGRQPIFSACHCANAFP